MAFNQHSSYVMELKKFRSLPPYPVIIFYPLTTPHPPPPQYPYPPQFYLCDWTNLLLVVNLVLGGSLVAWSSWVMIGLSFIMKCLCSHSCLGSVYNRQLLFLNFSVGRTSFLHPDLKYAESPCPVNVLPTLTPLPCIPNLHRFTCVTDTRRCPLNSLFGFCDFLILVICTLHLFVLFVFIFASCVRSLLFYMSIFVAMVNVLTTLSKVRGCVLG